MYHSLEKKCEDDEIETFASKFGCVLSCNVTLSLPFIIAYFVTLGAIVNLEKVGAEAVLWLSGLFALITLGMMRILSNPSQSFFKPAMLLKITEKEPDKVEKIRNRIVDSHKERIQSFFFSFTGAALVVLLITASPIIITTWSYEPANFTEPTNTTGSVTTSDFITILCSVNLRDLIPVFVLYTGGLIVSTAAGEVILQKSVPLRQYPVVKGKMSPKEHENNIYPKKGKGKKGPKKKKSTMG